MLTLFLRNVPLPAIPCLEWIAPRPENPHATRPTRRGDKEDGGASSGPRLPLVTSRDGAVSHATAAETDKVGSADDLEDEKLPASSSSSAPVHAPHHDDSTLIRTMIDEISNYNNIERPIYGMTIGSIQA